MDQGGEEENQGLNSKKEEFHKKKSFGFSETLFFMQNGWINVNTLVTFVV